MGRLPLALATGVLLLGPTALAFFAGGYFDVPRLVAGIVAWALVLVAAAVSPRPLPSSRAGIAAVAGLVLLCAWSAASLAWAPLAAAAVDSVTRLVLYVGALVAAIGLLRGPRAARAVEPALAVGAVAVVGYGLLGRLLPSVIELPRTWGAGSRLEQPISYWNALGALAAMGLVLCVRLAGGRSRALATRALGGAGAVPLATGLYLTYSRGALAVAVVGLVVLLAAAPTWPQLRAAAVGVGVGALAAGCVAALPGVATLEGSRGEQIAGGRIMLALLLALSVVAGLGVAAVARRERRGRLEIGELGVARRLPAVAAILVALTVVALVVAGLGEREGSSPQLGSREGAQRLFSAESRRYDYWRIALGAIGDDPLIGTGAGGFRVLWLRERPVEEGALEVHSLVLEMALELGLVGLLGLGLLVGGSAVAARRGLRVQRSLAAGPVAAGTIWLLHSAIDWDWQLPAVTLPALVLAGALIAASEAAPAGRRASRPGPARAWVPAPSVRASREPAAATRTD